MSQFEIFSIVALWAVTGLLGLIFKFVWSVAKKTDELWDVHLGPNALDDDRAPKWYVRKSLEDNVLALTDAITALRDVLRKIHDEEKDIKRAVSTIDNKQEEMKRGIDSLLAK